MQDNHFPSLEYDNTNADRQNLMIPTNHPSQLIKEYWQKYHQMQQNTN